MLEKKSKFVIFGLERKVQPGNPGSESLSILHLWSLQWVISSVYYKSHHLGENLSVS